MHWGNINVCQVVVGAGLPWRLATGQSMVGGKWLVSGKGHKYPGARSC